MKKIYLLSLGILISLFSYAQCGQTMTPSTPTNLAVVVNRPHTDPHLNWNTVYEACDYVVNVKLVTKQGQTYTEQQAAGYPFIVPNNTNFSQQDCWDRIAQQYAGSFKGAVTIKYEVSARNNLGVSTPINSQYVKIN